MTDRSGLFAGDDPIEIARRWLAEAATTEVNDPNAIALATVDADGLPNVRMVLLKEIEAAGFVFYTNYHSRKATEIETSAKAALVMHWKTLRRQVRVRGTVERVSDAQSDAYYRSRSLQSRLGAWASDQSQPLESRAVLMSRVARLGLKLGLSPERPPHWGGYRIMPVEIELWADGAFRLHDRAVFRRTTPDETSWSRERLYP